MDHQHVVLSRVKKNKTKGKENERQVEIKQREQDIVYECPVCSEQYDNEYEENIWIEYELYEQWYHLQCTMFSLGLFVVVLHHQ